jgi:uncharacterized protein YjiS (DUF1127 family)
MSYMASDDRRLVRLADRATPAMPSSSGSVQGFLIRIFDALGAWQDRAWERRHLVRLDDRILQDIGLDRAAVSTEATKPFWRA